MAILPYYNYLLNDFNQNIIIPENYTTDTLFHYFVYFYMITLFSRLINKTLKIYDDNNYYFKKKLPLIPHELIINDKTISRTKLHEIFNNLIENNLIHNLLLFFIFKVQGNIYIKCNKYHSHYYNNNTNDNNTNDNHTDDNNTDYKTNRYIILNVYEEYKFWQNIWGGENEFHFDMFKNNLHPVNYNITFDDNTQLEISLENLRFISWIYYSGIYNFIISKDELYIKLLLDAMNARKLLKGNELLQYHLGTIIFEEENELQQESLNENGNYDDNNSIWETDSEVDTECDSENDSDSNNEYESECDSDSENDNEYSKMLNKLDNRMDIISLGKEIMNSSCNIFNRIKNLLR